VDEDGEVVIADDYYPFGLQMPGRSYNNGLANNNYKYSGIPKKTFPRLEMNRDEILQDFKELDEEGSLDWYYFGARYYDPAIGRWLAVDPLADSYPSWSPYNYSMNDPIGKKDPDGRFVWGAIIGAAAEYAIQSVESGNWGTEGKDWGKIGVSAGAGLVSGGLSTLVKGARATAVVGRIAIGSGTSVAEGMAKNAMDGKPLTDGIVANGVTGGLGSSAGELVSSTTNKLLKTTLEGAQETFASTTKKVAQKTKSLANSKSSKAIRRQQNGLNNATANQDAARKAVDRAVVAQEITGDGSRVGTAVGGTVGTTSSVVTKDNEENR
jgi:RHS repeat-associated protein